MTTEQKHTPEPWALDTFEPITNDNAQWEICTISGSATPGTIATKVRIKNARRIVACVNACASMDDPAHGIAETAAILNRACLARQAAERQRDELAAALRGLYDLRSEWMNRRNAARERFATGPVADKLVAAMENARAALAKVQP